MSITIEKQNIVLKPENALKQPPEQAAYICPVPAAYLEAVAQMDESLLSQQTINQNPYEANDPPETATVIKIPDQLTATLNHHTGSYTLTLGQENTQATQSIETKGYYHHSGDIITATVELSNPDPNTTAGLTVTVAVETGPKLTALNQNQEQIEDPQFTVNIPLSKTSYLTIPIQLTGFNDDQWPIKHTEKISFTLSSREQNQPRQTDPHQIEQQVVPLTLQVKYPVFIPLVQTKKLMKLGTGNRQVDSVILVAGNDPNDPTYVPPFTRIISETYNMSRRFDISPEKIVVFSHNPADDYDGDGQADVDHSPPTTQQLAASLTQIFLEEPNSTVYLSVSSHGLPNDDGEFCLYLNVTTPVKLCTTELMQIITDAENAALEQNSDANPQVIVHIEACHSGLVIDNFAEMGGLVIPNGTRLIITSSEADQQSWTSPAGDENFTVYWNKALIASKGDIPAAFLIAARQIYSYTDYHDAGERPQTAVLEANGKLPPYTIVTPNLDDLAKAGLDPASPLATITNTTTGITHSVPAIRTADHQYLIPLEKKAGSLKNLAHLLYQQLEQIKKALSRSTTDQHKAQLQKAKQIVNGKLIEIEQQLYPRQNGAKPSGRVVFSQQTRRQMRAIDKQIQQLQSQLLRSIGLKRREELELKLAALNQEKRLLT